MDQRDIRRTLDEWASALEIDAKELYGSYEELLADEKSVRPQLSATEQQERALRRVRIKAKREHGPQAFASGTADAIIIGVSGLIDSTAKLRAEAEQLFRENPKQAVKLGVTTEKGVPIDKREKFDSGQANPFFGKPLRAHNYIQLIAGIAQLQQDDAKLGPLPFVATMDRNSPEAKAPPLFHRVKFPFSSYQDDESIYVVAEGEGEKRQVLKVGLRVRIPRGGKFEDVGPVDPMVAVRKYAPEIIVPLEQLDEWAAGAGDGRDRRLVAVEGDVVRMDLTPNEGTRNRRVNIDNGNDIKGLGTTVWVPDTVPIDFAEDSKTVCFGNARAAAAESTFSASINAMGIWAIPEYKVPLPEGLLPLPEPSEVPAELKPGQSASEALGEPPELSKLEGQALSDLADQIFGDGKPLPEPPKPNVPMTEAETLMFVLIHNGAKADKDGAKWTDIKDLAHGMKLNDEAIEKGIDRLLDSGRIYEGSLGRFKTLEEPTKAELALFQKRGGA